MRLLDKYTLKEFLGPFLFGVAAFTAIFLGADTLLKIASYVTKYGASPVSALKIFVLALPRIVVYTFSMAVLLGALMCFSRLSGSSELNTCLQELLKKTSATVNWMLQMRKYTRQQDWLMQTSLSKCFQKDMIPC